LKEKNWRGFLIDRLAQLPTFLPAMIAGLRERLSLKRLPDF
jgi:hypothetical protein